METSNKVARYFHNVALLAKNDKYLSFYVGKLKESGISYSVTKSDNGHLIVLEPTSEDNSIELTILVSEWEAEKIVYTNKPSIKSLSRTRYKTHAC